MNGSGDRVQIDVAVFKVIVCQLYYQVFSLDQEKLWQFLTGDVNLRSYYSYSLEHLVNRRDSSGIDACGVLKILGYIGQRV